MVDNTPMGKEQHHASNALALAGLGILIGMNILSFADHIFPKPGWMAIAIAGTLAFAYINFKNTVQDNSPWKSYGGWIMTLITVAIYAAPIGTAYIHQP